MNIHARFLAFLACTVVVGGMNAQTVTTPRKTMPGNGPYGVPQLTFFVHRLGTDHAEGITTLDLDGDGDIDIATAGKTGVHFFENLKVNNISAAEREKEILLNTNWPFPGEGSTVQQQNGPKNKLSAPR